jgi:hypothetical protein
LIEFNETAVFHFMLIEEDSSSFSLGDSTVRLILESMSNDPDPLVFAIESATQELEFSFVVLLGNSVQGLNIIYANNNISTAAEI